MTLDSILSSYHKCKKYSLDEKVSDYLTYIDIKPFYVAPSFSDVKTVVNQSTKDSKFIIFSAPGATGKSSLAKYIAHTYDAIYWNLSKVKIGTNSFAGTILSAVGPATYSSFIGDLNSGNVLLIIDAFDEAEIVSGRKMIDSFISDINNNLDTTPFPTVILLARTETAQYIASVCVDKSISVSHYEIGFFEEESAKDFIAKSIARSGKELSPSDYDCINEYYNVIKSSITEGESKSFLGYAPVLEAIAASINATQNRAKLISELRNKKDTDCVSIIMKILEELLEREQTKVADAFQKKCNGKYPQFDKFDMLYSPEEQLVRIISYILFVDQSYLNYELSELPPQMADEYQLILDTFLPQHPFIRIIKDATSADCLPDFTGPAFRDFTLANLILKSEHETIVDMYFDESQSQSYFPSQIFFDCYMAISNKEISANHISYVYDSYKAKATALERPYIHCSERASDGTSDSEYIAIFGMSPVGNTEIKHEDIFANICADDTPLQFEQLVNVSIYTPSRNVHIGKNGLDVRINNSTIICKKIEWIASHINIESYNGCLLVPHEGFSGNPTIEVIRSEKLYVCSPNINSYYKLIPYKYDFEDTNNRDITKFIHALRCILIEFRTHGKDTLAKTAERIDNVTVGNSTFKRTVLDYLKDKGIIYHSDHLYKVDEQKMQEKGIHFTALVRMDTSDLEDAYNDFCIWSK